jgi:Glycosyl hydrolase family 65, N-terminal domain
VLLCGIQVGEKTVVNNDLQQFMESALTPTSEPTWVMRQDGYDPTREIALESRFAIGNGLIGVRGSREVSRGPVWMYWQQPLSWASWPRTYIVGLFDTPDMVPPTPALTPAPDWLRVRVFLDGGPLLQRSGNLMALRRLLDLRRGLLITEWDHQVPSGHVTRIRSLRLVSMADRALGLQILTLRVEEKTAEIKFEALLDTAGIGLEPLEFETDLTTWRTALSGKELAIASTMMLDVDGDMLTPDAIEPLRRSWLWTSDLGQTATFLRLVAFTRGDNESERAGKMARTALSRGQQAG